MLGLWENLSKCFMIIRKKVSGNWVEEAAAAANGQEPGDIKVQDVDGNGVITTDDRIIYSQRRM